MIKSDFSLLRLADILDDLIDDRVGILREVHEVEREAGSPNFFHFMAQAGNTGAFTREKNFSTTGGASSVRDLAVAKAVGEAVERYCTAIYDLEELPLVPYAEASFPCVDPADFALYSAEQYRQPGFPWVPFEPATPVRWTPALDLATSQVCYVPAAMVYMPYQYYQGTGDAPIVQPISTGMACHCSPAEAAISAVCEVIERDAFLLTWQAGLAMPQIRVETLDDANYDRVARFEAICRSVVLLNITMDAGVPTILAVSRGHSAKEPALVFAAAADLNPEQAVRKSLEELVHTWRYSQQLAVKSARLVDDPEFENVVDQVDHLNFWCDPAHNSQAEFIFKSDKRIDFDEMKNLSTGDPRQDLKLLVDKVQAVNHRVLVVDLTTPDVKQLGLHVCRAIIPGFQPLFMSYKLRALGGSRLWEIPQKLGYKGVSRQTGDNPYPHPYP
ncbi:MAG: hypothetical protein JWP00_3891 [Chloroflexi bacterium]|jgi:ribosomal protein S12 methylthiotransferase accessory factor|nr:hypothetical protein [Chloroflexota bacterium]